MSADQGTHYAPAPLGRRFVAFAIDAAIGGLLLVLLAHLLVGLFVAFLGAPYWGWDAFVAAVEGTSTTTVYGLFALWLLATGLSFVWFVIYGLFRLPPRSLSLRRGQSQCMYQSLVTTTQPCQRRAISNSSANPPRPSSNIPLSYQV